MNLTIRLASDDDTAALGRLAVLDSSSPPTGDVLLAEMNDELWAALAVETDSAVADPFRPSGELVDLLRFRAKGLRGKGRRQPALPRLRPRAA
jgi:hypothetical protein